MARWALLSLCANGLLGAYVVAEEHPSNLSPAISSSMVTSAVLKLGEVRWNLGPAKTGGGLAVRWEEGIGRGDFVLADGALVGDVVGIAATGRLIGPDLQLVAVGVAVKGKGESSIRYAIAWAVGERTKLRTVHAWSCSKALLTAPLDRPFQTLTIAMPEGDSVLFTVQRLEHAGLPDSTIETHSFVNNDLRKSRPDNFEALTLHYRSMMEKPSNIGPPSSVSGNKGAPKP